MKILELLEQRIDKVRKHLNKEKQIMVINKEKEKIVMEIEVIIIKSDTSCDHNPFQATSDESSDHNPFQVSSNDTLKSSSEDTCSSYSTWEQKQLLKWYDDLSSDEQRIVYKGRLGLSARNAAITKPNKPKSRSKHLAPTTPITGSTCTTLVVLTKMPPPVMNYVLDLVDVTTWQQILNKEFGIKRSKEDVGGKVKGR
ncbi:hypothetical protein Tco_0502546 [Tanacetum coccineum]